MVFGASAVAVKGPQGFGGLGFFKYDREGHVVLLGGYESNLYYPGGNVQGIGKDI